MLNRPSSTSWRLLFVEMVLLLMSTCFFPQFWCVHEKPDANLLKSFVHWKSTELNLCAWFATRCGDKLRSYLIRPTRRISVRCRSDNMSLQTLWFWFGNCLSQGKQGRMRFGFICNWRLIQEPRAWDGSRLVEASFKMPWIWHPDIDPDQSNTLAKPKATEGMQEESSW